MTYYPRTAHGIGFGSIRAGSFAATIARSSRRIVIWLAVSLSLATAAEGASSESLLGTTYDDAVRSIPFEKMTDEAQGRLWRIVSQPSLYRRLPVTRVQADPDMYLFLIRHPEVVVNMWDLMGVTKVQIRRSGSYTFDASDGAGTTSRVELIYGDRDVHVILAEGTYEGALFKRLVHGRCLLVLRTHYQDDRPGTTDVTHQLDIFLQLDNVGAELIAKTLQPLVGKTADHNFIEASRFVGQVSQAAETRPAGVQQLAERLTKVDPAIRERFAALAAQVHARASSAAGANAAARRR